MNIEVEGSVDGAPPLKQDGSFVAVITALLALFGWLAGRGALPWFRRGEGSLFETFSARARVALGAWLGTLAIFSLVLPLASAIAWHGQRVVRLAMVPYALVLVVQIFTEVVFSRLFFPNIVAVIGVTYTPYRLRQLWRAREILQASGERGGRVARAIASIGLGLWAINLGFLLVSALPRVIGRPQAKGTGTMGPAEKALYRVLNPAVRQVLRSRAHGLLSDRVVLLTFVGRKSGRSLTVPVGYAFEGEDMVCVTGRNGNNWWKNLRGGAPARVRLPGGEFGCWAEIVEHEEFVARGLGAFLQKYQSTATRYGVGLDTEGRPAPEDVASAARGGEAVVIRVHVDQSSRSAFSS